MFNPPLDLNEVKGFLAHAEAEALYRHALASSELGPVLEIGSYCGKSTICLGLACQETGSLVYALDHHGGSEEHQLGEMFHDPDLYDATDQRFDSFREFRRNIQAAGVSEQVVPIVASSEQAARYWNTDLGMVFIDGGHSLEAAQTDYRCWAMHVARGGILAIHDVFPDAATGGHAPYAVHRLAIESGLFSEIERAETLSLLRRL